MSFQAWAAFTAATFVLLVIPGPTILLVVSYALGRGMRAAFPMAVGVALPSPVQGMPVVCLNASGPAFAFNAETMRRQIAPALIQLARQIVP